MDDIERFICNQQKELYETMQQEYVDIRKFSDAFMRSRFCNASIDKPYSVDQFSDIVNWIEFLEQEFIIQPDPLQKYPVSFSAAGWIGFVYRHLHFVTGLSSSQLSEMVPVNKLIISYPGLHTIDEDILRRLGL